MVLGLIKHKHKYNSLKHPNTNRVKHKTLSSYFFFSIRYFSKHKNTNNKIPTTPRFSTKLGDFKNITTKKTHTHREPEHREKTNDKLILK